MKRNRLTTCVCVTIITAVLSLCVCPLSAAVLQIDTGSSGGDTLTGTVGATPVSITTSRTTPNWIINDDVTLNHRLRLAGLDPADLERLFEIPEMKTSVHVAFSRNTSPDIVARFAISLQKMKTDGTFNRIWQKWHAGQNTAP